MRSMRLADTHVIALAGELELATASEVEDELRSVELSCVQVIAIDLRELTFIDSTGVRLLVQAQERSCQGTGRLILVKASDAIHRIFEICDLASRLPFVDQLPLDTATELANPATGLSAARAPDTTRAATRRRASRGALATAVRELRTHTRHATTLQPRQVL
jgi:anti-anti-sigma factor